jgi:hypothetical protein
VPAWRGADLSNADLRFANLEGADLSDARCYETNFNNALLNRAQLARALPVRTLLVETDFTGANLDQCCVYGIAAWNLKLDGATQTNLLITAPGEPAIAADKVELAQFLYLILYNENLREVIDTLTSKVVLILGRFTPERKRVLDALQEALLARNYVPVFFDFEGPASRDVVETVTILARMARFIVADLTDAAMVRTERVLIVHELPSVPVKSLLESTSAEFVEFAHIKRYRSVLPIYRYTDVPALLGELQERVTAPAEAKVIELRS